MTTMRQPPKVELRTIVRAEDIGAVREIVTSTRFFSDAEITVAVELIEDRVSRGERSEYRFLFAEQNGRTIGYACYGPIACTVGSFDLYWIAVHPSVQGAGIGKKLLAAAEGMIAGESRRHVYVETSSREQYDPTRIFYEHNRYRIAAVLPDFYAPGDDKVIYVKQLGGRE